MFGAFALMVTSTHYRWTLSTRTRRPLFRKKRTFHAAIRMSALGQKATWDGMVAATESS